MNQEKSNKINRFIGAFDSMVRQLETYSGFLNLNDKQKELRKDALNILNKKRKELNKAESKKDLKKIIKVKKIISDGR